MDLDRFKNINDALGHTIGDQVLKQMAVRFSGLLRPSDVLARLGGDEFIILANPVENQNEIDAIADKILASASTPIRIEGHEFYIDASIGISRFPEDGKSMESLLKNADMAMYKSKHGGGGGATYYTQDMDATASEHMKMEAALRRAIQNKEFVLYFQPQLDLRDDATHRVEALIRWQDPNLGLISPAAFIPIAEETGLIMPIGEWAVNEACRIAKKWQNEGYNPISIAVNISPKQFKHQDVAQTVEDALKNSRLDPQYLEIEITETAVMDDVDEAIIKLKKIRDMGVKISMDDFGSGYTSINYLRQYPISILKIDQTFIKGLPSHPNDVAITTAVIALGHNLGMEIVAEGVETAEQMQFLAENGCDLIQGYFLSRPLPESKIILEFTKNGVQSSRIILLSGSGGR